ncbi:Rad2 nuclease [Orbilia oligospora]|uniref:Rad2 nuclease n=1 Tax=Orbilia oligospora TaxID=2813651 RepID=A0A7C8VAP3_ORBOL|nr:Rad2 nuclease [Orbilia oligospora]
MGISGLLPFLKSIQQPTHIKKWKGKRVAVDAYGWLHRGIISCAVDLALDKPTTRYVDYAMHRVRMLQHYGVTPYLVFDGDYLPGKKGTELDREKRRKSSRETGLELLRLGRASQAQSELQKSIDVTPLMARRLIDELKKANIPYIVAPYEADAQMAYLERIGEVSAILSEDSDLLVFGAKCLLTKLGQYGECIAIHRSDFPGVSGASMAGWSDSEFCRMAVLSGCDYLGNIPKMGIKTAYKFVRRYKSADKIVRAIRMDGSFAVPASYEKDFIAAEMTFKYQRVYCPLSCQLISCNGDMTLPDDVGAEQERNFGGIYDAETACKQKPRITSFFAPRAALAEITSSRNNLASSREPTSANTHKTSLKQAVTPKVLLGAEKKKRRFCTEVENDNTQDIDYSPFFTKPSKSVKTLAKDTISKPTNLFSLKKNRTESLLKSPDSSFQSMLRTRSANRVVRLRTKAPVGAPPEPKSDGSPPFKMISLASFRFGADTSSGSLGAHPSTANPEDKENRYLVH